MRMAARELSTLLEGGSFFEGPRWHDGRVRVDPDGTVSVAAEDLLFPNGSVITPDGGTLIVGETAGGRSTAFTIQPDGSLTVLLTTTVDVPHAGLP